MAIALARMNASRPTARRRRALIHIEAGFALFLYLSNGDVHAAEREPCPDAVRLEGEVAVTKRIAAILTAHGLSQKTRDNCPLVRAQIGRQGSLISVRIREEVRHLEQRVNGISAAASLIESWTRSDISAPLLSHDELRALPRLSEKPPLPAPPLRAPRLLVALLIETGLDTSSTLWLGANLRVCGQLGPLCLGGLWRVSGELPSTPDELAIDRRIASDLYVSMELPLKVGPLLLSPGGGFGVGWVRHQVSGHLDGPLLRGLDAAGTPFFADASEAGLRVEARLQAALPLRRGVDLEFGLSLYAAFLNGTPPVIPLTVARSLTLEASAWGGLRGSLGLRWRGL